MASKRCLGEVIELDRDCELGREGERAVVIHLDNHYMTLVFPNRDDPDQRRVLTGSDYVYVRSLELSGLGCVNPGYVAFFRAFDRG